MCRIFLNETTGNILQLGDTLKMHALAKTLEEIAEHGVDIFYKGSVGTKVVEDTQRRGGILTKDDLLHYRFVLVLVPSFVGFYIVVCYVLYYTILK